MREHDVNTRNLLGSVAVLNEDGQGVWERGVLWFKREPADHPKLLPNRQLGALNGVNKGAQDRYQPRLIGLRRVGKKGRFNPYHGSMLASGRPSR